MARKLTIIRQTTTGVEHYEKIADGALKLIGKCDAGEVAGDLLPDARCDEMLEDLERIDRTFDLQIPALPELTVIDGGGQAPAGVLPDGR